MVKSDYQRKNEVSAMRRLPDKDKAFPNPNIPSLCYIKNVVKNPRIIIGDYTYYDDSEGADRFEEHITHYMILSETD